MKRLPAYTTYIIMESSLGLFMAVIFVASSIYQVTVAGLSPLQLVLVGTMLELSVFLFEVPTGVVADVYSRRLSIIIGTFLIGLGFLVEGSFPRFFPILLAQVLWGVGFTFTSGATQAWISDEVGEAEAGRAFLRVSQFRGTANFVGGGLGIFLGAYFTVNVPIQVGGLLVMLVGLFLAFFMPETGFKPTPREERSSWQHLWHTFRLGLETVRGRKDLMTILLIGLFFGLFSEGFDRLWTKHLVDSFGPEVGGMEPVLWLGFLRGAGVLLSVAAAEWARRKIPTDNPVGIAKSLFGVSVLLIVGLFGFALAGGLWPALAFYLLISMTRNVIGPVYDAWVNRGLDSGVRATVLSMGSQVDAIGQIAGGPGVGLIGSLISVRAALATSALILIPVLPLFRRAQGQAQPVPEPSVPPES